MIFVHFAIWKSVLVYLCVLDICTTFVAYRKSAREIQRLCFLYEFKKLKSPFCKKIMQYFSWKCLKYTLKFDSLMHSMSATHLIRNLDVS